MKNNRYSKREFLGWVCLWGLGASLLTKCSNSEASEYIQVPEFQDVHKVHNLSTQELLTTNLYHESRSESDKANYIIMAVVERRKQLGGRYGSSYEDVVLKPKAFTWTGDGLSDMMYEKSQYKRLYRIVDDFLINKNDYMQLAKGVDHYVKVGHTTTWDYSKLEFMFRIDNHLFYKHK